jgi:hypothetical protein
LELALVRKRWATLLKASQTQADAWFWLVE